MKEFKRIKIIKKISILSYLFITISLLGSKGFAQTFVSERSGSHVPGHAPTEAVISVEGQFEGVQQNVEIHTTEKYAGAITEMYVNGVQLINRGAKRYGRLLQMATWKHGSGRCFNPIEAGGRFLHDLQAQTPNIPLETTTEVQNFEVFADGKITSHVTPSFFRRYGDVAFYQPNFGLVLCDTTGAGVLEINPSKLPPVGAETDQTIRFGKTVTMGVFNNPLITQVQLYNKSLVRVDDGYIFQLYAALVSRMKKIHSIDLKSCGERLSQGLNHCIHQTVNSNSPSYTKKKLYMISTASGDQAFAFYTPDPDEMSEVHPNLFAPTRPSYKARKVVANDEHLNTATTNYTVDMSVNFSLQRPVEAGEVLRAPVFVLTGSLAQVKKNLVFLMKRFETLP